MNCTHLIIFFPMFRSMTTAKPTFLTVFEGKESQLRNKLTVCGDLLAALKDIRLLNSVSHIEAEVDGKDKVSRLLNSLKKADDSKFDDFCEALVNCGQNHVIHIFCPKEYDKWTVKPKSGNVDIEGKKRELASTSRRASYASDVAENKKIAMLKRMIEPRYGLTDDLYKNEVLTSEQLEEIARDMHKIVAVDDGGKVIETAVVNRARTLLDFVVRILRRPTNESTLEALKDAKSFLEALKNNNQSHVASFIESSGVIASIPPNKERPLDEQQHRRFHPSPEMYDFTDLNSRDDKLQSMLTGKRVLSSQQLADIMCLPDSISSTSNECVLKGESNRRLLLIMERKSLSAAKTFIQCLHETGQTTVVQYLTEPGVFPNIHSSMKNEAMRSIESWLMQNNQCPIEAYLGRGQSDHLQRAASACEPLQEKWHQLKKVLNTQIVLHGSSYVVHSSHSKVSGKCTHIRILRRFCSLLSLVCAQ